MTHVAFDTPEFTLYGDGKLVYRLYDGELRRYFLLEGVLTQAAIQEVLQRAVVDARFYESKEFYATPYVAGKGGDTISVNTSNGCYEVVGANVWNNGNSTSLGFDEEDAAQVQRLAKLDQWLRSIDLRGEHRPGWEDVGPFIPDSIDLVVRRIGPEQVYGEVTPWPFPEIDLKSATLWPDHPTIVNLEDELGREVYKFLTDKPSGHFLVGDNFSQGDTVAFVEQRPHMPFESTWRDGDVCS